MTSKERVLHRERQRGYDDAKTVQNNVENMTGTELNAVDDRIPRFVAAVSAKNMLDRPVGFVCKSSAGRVVKLLQVYDSNVFAQEPEELPAQWGFKWSKDPLKARPFIQLATSPYMIGDCCIDGGKVYRSRIDNNVHAPSAYHDGWEEVS